MGDWMTVNIVGTIDPADVAAAREFVEIGGDIKEWGRRFHCLCYTGMSLCGLGRWIPEAGGEISVVGNLSERNYGVEDVASTLRDLVAVAPSLRLKVHCGGEYESTDCVATVTVEDQMVTVGEPEVAKVGEGLQETASDRLFQILAGGMP